MPPAVSGTTREKRVSGVEVAADVFVTFNLWFSGIEIRGLLFLTSLTKQSGSCHGLGKLLSLWLLLAGVSQLAAHGTHSSLLAAIDRHLADEPTNGGLWYQRAILLYEHEDWAAAATDFAKAERCSAGEFPILLWQGRILDQQGETQAALAALDAFLANSPGHWAGLIARARVLAKFNQTEKSLADYRAALARHPQAEPDLIQEVAQALAGNDLTDEAVALLDNSLQRRGRIPSLQIKLLDIEIAAARYDSALARLDAFQASAPRPEIWMEKRAAILAEAGRYTESAAAWRALLAHLNALPPAQRDSHAMVLCAGRARQAITILARTRQP